MRRAAKRQPILVEMVVPSRFVGVEAIRVTHGFSGKPGKVVCRLAIYFDRKLREMQPGEPMGSPLERADKAVGVTGGQLALPAIHQPGVESGHRRRNRLTCFSV